MQNIFFDITTNLHDQINEKFYKEDLSTTYELNAASILSVDTSILSAGGSGDVLKLDLL